MKGLGLTLELAAPPAPVVHIRAPGGTAVCGTPAKQEHIQPWGGDIDCRTCILIYSARAGGRT